MSREGFVKILEFTIILEEAEPEVVKQRIYVFHWANE
jgi:hypothetical protein